PEDPRWTRVQDAVAHDLVAVPALHLVDWLEALRSVRQQLLRPLQAVYSAAQRPETERALATDLLAAYAVDDPKLLVDLLHDAESRQYAVLFPLLERSREQTMPLLRAELARTPETAWPDAALDPTWATPSGDLVRQVEEAQGMVAERFALC